MLTASGDDLTNTDDPFKVAMRQIAGAFAQLDKARLVAKLRGARERKRASGVKVDGRTRLGLSVGDLPDPPQACRPFCRRPDLRLVADIISVFADLELGRTRTTQMSHASRRYVETVGFLIALAMPSF